MAHNNDWTRIEAARVRKMDQAAAASWRHPADREPTQAERKRDGESDMARALVESVILPVIWRKRRGVRVGFAAFVIMVRQADASYFGQHTDAEVAKALRMSLNDFHAEARDLLKLSARARECVGLLRVILECVLPPAGYGLRRWEVGYKSLVCMLYAVAPEAFNGMTKLELARVLGLPRSKLMARFARVHQWIAARSDCKNCKNVKNPAGERKKIAGPSQPSP
jgi:hypothetical protein